MQKNFYKTAQKIAESAFNNFVFCLSSLQLEYEDSYSLVVLNNDRENIVIPFPNERIPPQVHAST